MGEDAEGIRRRWAAWAVEAMGGDEASAGDAARAAIHAVEAGASDAVAAVFGRMTRLAPTEADVAMLGQELRRVRRTRLDLTLQSLTESELERQRAHYARLDGLLASALAQAQRHQRPAPPNRAPLHTAVHVGIAIALVVGSVLLAAFHVGPGAGLGIVCLALAHTIYSQRWSLSWAPAVCLSLAVLTIGHRLGMGSTALGIVLVGMAAVYMAAAALARRTRTALWPTAALHLLVVATMLPDMLWAHVAMLAAAAALAAALAVQAGRPSFLPLSLALGTVCAYWAARVWMPEASTSLIGTVATVLAPLPLLAVVAGLAVRVLARSSGSGRRWAIPLYGYAAVMGLVVLAAGLRGLEVPIWSVLLAAYALAGYAVAILERWTPLAVPNLIALLAAPLGLFTTPHMDVTLLPIGFSGLAIAVTLAQFAGRGAAMWREMHVAAGFAIAGCTALACLVSPAFWPSGTARPLAAMVPLATISALFLLESRLPRRHFLAQYPATLALSMSALWVARFLGATNPEWYVIVPSVTIAVLAVKAPRDPVLPTHPLGVCRACAALGCVVPLAVTAYLSLDGDAALYSLILLGQSGLCFAAGLRFGNRALIVCGILGSAATLMRGLGFLSLLLPPTAAIAVAVLLVSAAAMFLVLARHSVEAAWIRLSRAWRSGL